ncbi:DUF4214 domain-containing protein [Noviherbaspirillum saxi]|uniref:DUF4214 domain-containing protein n=1 Tax=Noviherbaspirillum saxi TaxID=2320863 RepID=A0A3A3FU68_9BURK|nr:DUF4214 domain-containing protein [Noviherbaspirillum saxi]RJF98068.1 DUF4214 domain-containing protein [Noviherbaspirillum saxi]
MATPGIGLLPLTGSNGIDALTNGTYWNLDPSRTITWALANFGSQSWPNPSATAASITQAFNTFSYFAHINFRYTGHYPDPNTANADMVFSLDGTGTIFSSANTWALGYFPNSQLTQALLPPSLRAVYTNAPGDIWMNLSSFSAVTASYTPGAAGFYVLLHEIGHTLGLKHPHDNGGTGHPTFNDVGGSLLDIDAATIMSYNETNPLSALSLHPASPMILDVIALQSIYGANLATNAGDTRHMLTNTGVFQTFFDPSGSDYVDASTSQYGWNINLGIVEQSGGLPFSIGVAEPRDGAATSTTLDWLYGSFEGVMGSGYADAITGSSANEWFAGWGGNDNITGGTGTDYAVFYRNRSDFTVTRNTAGMTVNARAGNEGSDSLSGIERLKFQDQYLAFDTEGTAGQAYRLYQAAFDRKPDNGGLGSWIGWLDQGNALRDAAAFFQTTPEFISKYGSNVPVSSFVTLLYQNVLHRAPDAGGMSTWTTVLGSNQWSRADVLLGFSESAENKAALIGVMQNGMEFTV